MTLERTAWALRNLTAASGLNTAITAASGITPKALEDACGKGGGHSLLKAHGEKQAAPPLLTPQPKQPPPPRPQPLVTAQGDEENRHQVESPPSDSHGVSNGPCVGVALTQWSKTGRAW